MGDEVVVDAILSAGAVVDMQNTVSMVNSAPFELRFLLGRVYGPHGGL